MSPVLTEPLAVVSEASTFIDASEKMLPVVIPFVFVRMLMFAVQAVLSTTPLMLTPLELVEPMLISPALVTFPSPVTFPVPGLTLMVPVPASSVLPEPLMVPDVLRIVRAPAPVTVTEPPSVTPLPADRFKLLRFRRLFVVIVPVPLVVTSRF